MDEQFWHGKWLRNEIAFHEAQANVLLLRNLPALRLSPGARVFVPLCGKTRDIHWLLAHGYRVAGAELSRLAIEQLFNELGVSPTITQAGNMLRVDAGDLSIWVGNIFDLDRETLGPIEAVYDRAALVALPQDMRERYTAHLLALTGTAPQLLVTLDYDPQLMAGPPFSVTEREVRRHYEATHRITCAERREVKLKGTAPAHETVWLVEP